MSMRSLQISTTLCSFLFIFLFGTLLANAQQTMGKVTGVVVDENQLLLPFAQLSLKRSIDSAVVKALLADDKGQFSFESNPGSYFIEVKLMGYATTYSKVFELIAAKTVLLGNIKVKSSAIQLATVQVSAALPFVERRADKLIVNLNGLGSGAAIMEVMNQLPGVVVTPDDRISLNGKSVQIYIDGKATNLSAEALSGMLKGMSSAAIQKVELIAQPSAKYDAAGNGAIINIIRKRNYKAGFNGNIYAGAGKGEFGKANGGINLNYKGKVYNLLLSMDYNNNQYFYNSLIETTLFQTNGSLNGQTISDIPSKRSTSNYTPNLGLDFYLSKRTTLSATVKPGFQVFERDGTANIIQKDQNGSLTARSQFQNVVSARSSNFSSGLRLQHQLDTLGRELSADIDYYHYGNYNDQHNQTTLLDLNSNPVSSLPSVLAQDRVFDVYALKMDYTHPLAKGKQLEMGMKTSLVNAVNANTYSDFARNETDLFDYKESISALYFIYARNGKKFSYQLGLRGEYTNGAGEQQLGLNHFSRSYFQAFPSLHMDYKWNANHSLSLGLNKRVERPAYESLNPLVRIISANQLQQGNPALKPLVAYNADLWYGYQNAFYFGITYSYALKDFTSLAVPLANNVITTMPGNAKYSGYATLQAMYGKQVLPWWYTSTNAILSQRSFKGMFNGTLLQNKGIAALSVTSYHNFSLSQNFSFMLLFNYRGENVERTITNKATAYLTAGIRQQFLKKRASLQLNFMDIFKSYKNIYQQNSGAVQQLWQNQLETRMVKLNFSYSFGGAIKNTKKSNSAEEEKKRSTMTEN